MTIAQVRDLLLVAPDDTLVERLALAAVEAIEQRDTWRAIALAALGQQHDRLRAEAARTETIARLRAELREQRPAPQVAA